MRFSPHRALGESDEMRVIHSGIQRSMCAVLQLLFTCA